MIVVTVDGNLESAHTRETIANAIAAWLRGLGAFIANKEGVFSFEGVDAVVNGLTVSVGVRHPPPPRRPVTDEVISRLVVQVGGIPVVTSWLNDLGYEVRKTPTAAIERAIDDLGVGAKIVVLRAHGLGLKEDEADRRVYERADIVAVWEGDAFRIIKNRNGEL